MAFAVLPFILPHAFLLQAEEGIRDELVTGVQTCALPIWNKAPHPALRSRECIGFHPTLSCPEQEGTHFDLQVRSSFRSREPHARNRGSVGHCPFLYFRFAWQHHRQREPAPQSRRLR